MDFSFSEEQIMLGRLAREILEKEISPERLAEIEAGSDPVDRALWSKLAEANLLGLSVPEELGGMGFGFLELCMLLQEIGRAVAPVPALSTLVLGGLPIAAFGSEAQKERWLRPMAAGELMLSAALEDAESDDPTRPGARARRDASGFLLEGHKHCVPHAGRAARVLVPAALDDGVGIFLVDPNSDGVEAEPRQTSTGEPLHELRLSGLRLEESDLLGGPEADGASMSLWIRERALVATCATQIGVTEKALEMTADYVREREQFGAPIGSFQAVQHRAADAYTDLSAIRWTTWRAAWKLSLGMPASREVAVAKFWAAEAGARITGSAQHLHGGMGVDMDYPLHRFFLWSKSLELSLGGAAAQLTRLGRDMARTGPQELS
jgi:alkylation response protein AidB-like acyl-CoA dehydrogenase